MHSGSFSLIGRIIKMKTIILLGLFAAFSVVLAQRHDDQQQQRQHIVRSGSRAGSNRQQIRDFGPGGNSRGNIDNGPYGCPGCRGGYYGGREPGWGRGWRGADFDGQGQGYGPGRRWGSRSRGPHRMSDIFGMRGNDDGMNYGPMHHGRMGHHRGFSRGHGYGHRYMQERLCPAVCPEWYSPVCGSDGQTYRNMCLLRKEACRGDENLTVDRRGQC